MWRIGTGKKRFFYLALACLGVLGLYWLKNQADINLFRQFSLHRYFPFSLLQHEKVIFQPRGPVKLHEGFESLLPLPAPWHKLSTNRPRKVQESYESAAAGGSRHLVVTSQAANGWWHITHRNAMEVEPGDQFILGGTLAGNSAAGYAQVQVSAFDHRGELIERDRWFIEADTEGGFRRVEKVFSISPGVSRIRLRIAGRGAGQFKFDDLSLVRLQPGEK